MASEPGLRLLALLDRTYQIHEKACGKISSYQFTEEDIKDFATSLFTAAKKIDDLEGVTRASLTQRPEVIEAVQKMYKAMMGTYSTYLHTQTYELLQELASLSLEDYLYYAATLEKYSIEKAIILQGLVESKMQKAFDDNEEELQKIIETVGL